VSNGNGAKPETQTSTNLAVASTPKAPEVKAPVNSAGRRGGRARAQVKPTKSAKSAGALLAGRLEEMLGDAEDGLSAVTISKLANAGYNQVLGLLRELEAAGKVRRTGTRRTSLWRLIDDEEWIAQRTAELERLNSASSGSSLDEGAGQSARLRPRPVPAA
jgi:hypothetical protein